jgi:TPR repeat protein
MVKDLEKARGWLGKAAAQGHVFARHLLSQAAAPE